MPKIAQYRVGTREGRKTWKTDSGGRLTTLRAVEVSKSQYCLYDSNGKSAALSVVLMRAAVRDTVSEGERLRLRDEMSWIEI